MTIKVKLGDTDYAVPKMNIGQIEDFSALNRGDAKWTSETLAVLLRRAEPKVADVRELEATPEQIAGAIDAILIGSGWKKPDSKDPNPKAPGKPGRHAEG